ncbi:filamentous hemagglutinin N-terminal domain-containing protein, partial [Argonema antarcticum]|uniref:two-partner secretion domain-containing protein n=1 Tax=Argonema antarcticum TaxID=2942763 RepID=UPI0020113B5E
MSAPISTITIAQKSPKQSVVRKTCLWLAAIPIAGVIGVNRVQAQPIVPAADGTGTVVTPQGNLFDITGGTKSGDGANLFHSFTEFGLNPGQIANFLSRPDILNILARINGGNVSFINGLIQVTGGNSNLFLMNPSGIVFGANANLNVPAAFMATTANGIGFGNVNWFNATGNNNYAALVGKPNAFAFTMSQPGNIINSGNLAVGLGQDLTLLGGTVINTGQLSAPAGNITITAVPGESLVRLSQPGYLLNLEVKPIVNTSILPNNWTLPISSLPQMLTGGSGGNATGVTLNKDGSVQLTGSGIQIPTEGNTAIASGTINAAGETGGQVNIFGDKVGVISANIDVSGTNGGGSVRIGGDYQGKGTVPNASRTFVSKDSIISADSLLNGNGGRVIVWSDDTTRFYGNITARGGSQKGDGGFVETSGKNSLDIEGARVDASAVEGEAGTWLLDPRNVLIGDFSTEGGDFSGGNPDIFTPSADDAKILPTDIENALNAGTSVTITTGTTGSQEGNITVDLPINRTSGSNATLKLDAANKIVVNSDIINDSSNPLNVVLLAGGDISVRGSASISTKGGDIKFTSTNGAIGSFGTLNSSNDSGTGGNIILNAATKVVASTIDAKGASGSGEIRISGSEIDFVNTVSGGAVTLEPVKADQNIIFTGDNEIDTAALDISSSDIGNLQNIKSITIGRTDGNGIVTVDPTGVNFTVPVTIQAGGAITANGNITTTGKDITIISKNGSINTSAVTVDSSSSFVNGGSIALDAKGDIITGDIKSNALGSGNGGEIKLTSGSIIDTSNGSLNSSSASGNGGAMTMTAPTSITIGPIDSRGTPGSGNINLTNDEINFTGGSNSVQSKGAIKLEPFTPNQNLAIGEPEDTGSTTLDITATDIAALDKTGFTSITIGQGISGNGLVTIEKTGNINVVDDVKARIDLTLNAGTADITFKGAIGNSQPLGNLTINNTNKVTLNGNITTTNNRTISFGNSNAVSLNGDTALTADEINFNQKANSVSGTGKLILQPTTASQGIAIGGSGDTGSSTLDLTSTDIAALNDGFSSIAIGRENSTGVINIAGDVTFQDSVLIQSPVDAGTIVNNGGAIAGTDNASITLKANQNITLGNITSPAGITITSNNGIIDTKAGILDSSASGTGGPIALTAKSNIATKDILSFSSETGSGGKITLNSSEGTIDTSLGILDSSSNNSNGGNIDINAPTSITAFGINSTGNIGGNINLTSNKINFTGATDSVKSKGNILLQPFTPSQNLEIGTLNFNALVDGFQSITIGRNDGSGVITFNSAFTFSDPVIIQSPLGSIVTFAPITGVDDASITITGNTTLKGNITTDKQNININGNILVDNNIAVTTGATFGGNIIINGKIDGDRDITLEAGTGDITVSGDIGSTTRLGNVSIDNANNVTIGAITAASITQKVGTGNTTWGALNTNTSAGINLKGNNFNLDGAVTTTNSGGFTIDNESPLNIAITTDFNLDGAFNQIGKGEVSTAGDITTTNDDISFSSPVILRGNVALNTGKGVGDINFGKTVDGNFDFNLSAGEGNINFAGGVGNQTRIGNLIIDNAKNVKAGEITAASITQNAGTGTTILETLDTNTTQGINLSSNNFKFDGTIATSNNGGVTINNSGEVNIADAADMKLEGTFKQIGKGAVFTAGDIFTNNNDIRFGGAVILNGNVIFNPGIATIAFGSSLTAGNNPLTLTAGEIDFGGPVSGSSTILLQPATKDSNVAIGSSIPGAFNLTVAEIANLQDGFSNITVGREDGTGTTTVKDVTFSDPVTIRSQSGAIAVNGPIIGTDNASITLDSDTTTLNAGISTTGENITVGRSVLLGNDVTLSTGKGDITFNGTVNGNNQLTLNVGNGNVRFNAAVGAQTPLSNLDIISAQNVFVAGGVNITNNLLFNVPIILTDNATFSGGAGKDITFNNLNSEAGKANNLTLNPGTGNITFNGAVSGIGDILILSANNLTAASTIDAASLQHSAGTGEIGLLGNVSTTGVGGVDLRTNGSIRAGNITSNGHNINAIANNSTIETGNLDASKIGTGGNIYVSSPKAAVTTGDLTARGETQGGAVTVVSGDRITTANIDVSATVGKGGSVLLDPPNDIRVGTINAQGGNSGDGGNVDITTARFFRATGTLPDGSSISTAGGTGNGAIIIRHGGGDLNTPFVVGDASTNGTLGALTTGADTISPTQSFPGPFTLGNIQIITSAPPPQPEPPQPEPPQPPQPEPPQPEPPQPPQPEPPQPEPPQPPQPEPPQPEPP